MKIIVTDVSECCVKVQRLNGGPSKFTGVEVFCVAWPLLKGPIYWHPKEMFYSHRPWFSPYFFVFGLINTNFNTPLGHVCKRWLAVFHRHFFTFPWHWTPKQSDKKHGPTKFSRAGKVTSSCIYVTKYSLHFMGPGGVVDTADNLQGWISTTGLTINVPNMASPVFMKYNSEFNVSVRMEYRAVSYMIILCYLKPAWQLKVT